ncbi:GAF and ANTAR domain-containing protein [Streptomyces sp. SID13726]|uniref:GAF and ANTAR domain-containing protein n=1 Tax=Streptomyces sp. SID13726 TaxID=2706058 RepID=UPI0013BD3D70|nr:GAF and ANTAR domain-containing protein [Streptomyces sp. SID13726]NEB04750.1 GAF and ANTAR domain-containing protein [Streptomyces sp. SID13726]
MRYATREIQLATALVEAADTLVEGFEATRYLQRLSDHCVELLAARAAGVMLIDDGRAVSLAAGSRHEEMTLELLEAQHGGGPCLETYSSGRAVAPVSVRVAHADARWPGFTEQALRHDVVATFAVPLCRRGTLLGALNVFTATLPVAVPGETSLELQVAQALGDAAALGLQNRRTYTRYRTLSGQLQEALSSRVRIEQAKGMLAERWGVPADRAFVALRQYARRQRLPLDRVASAVIEGAADGAGLRRELDENA